MRKLVIVLFVLTAFAVTNLNAQNGTADKELKEAERFYKDKNYISAIILYKKNAVLLKPEERFFYAYCLVHKSQYSQDDVTEAINQLKMASNRGYTPAMVALYDIYLANRLVPQDRSQAVTYISRAADYEDTAGLYIYGSMLNAGDFISRDTVKGYQLIVKSASKKYYDALNALGYMHYTGSKAPKDLSKAAYYWKQAAETGKEEAVYNYSLVLLETNTNVPSAIANLQKLNDKGFAPASAYLGNIYHDGLYNIPKNIEKGLEYYRASLYYYDYSNKKDKKTYDAIKAIVAKYGAIEPNTDIKLLRTAFDALINRVTSTPVIPTAETDKRKYIQQTLEDAYKKLGALGFRDGKIRFGQENAPLNPLLLTNPFHTYETDIVQVVSPESAEKTQKKWLDLIKKIYPEHVNGTEVPRGISFQVAPDKGYIHIHVTYFTYSGSGYPLSSRVILTIYYANRSKL